jgi:predicted XRE-type DNA-binding protein
VKKKKDLLIEQLDEWIRQSNMSKNQIASVAGMTVSYLNALGNRVIQRVDRKRIIALGCALNLQHEETNKLLKTFRLAEIDEEDVETFVEVARMRKLSQKLQPMYTDIHFNSLVLSVESMEGKLVTVNADPSDILKSSEQVLFDKPETEYDALTRKILLRLHQERNVELYRNSRSYQMEFFLFGPDLEGYITEGYEKYKDHCLAARSVNYTVTHLVNTFQHLHNYPNYTLYIVGCRHPFRFELKFPEGKDRGQKGKLFFIAPDHDKQPTKDTTFLIGYGTEDEYLFRQFEEEYRKIKSDSLTEYRSDSSQSLAAMKEKVVELFGKTSIREDERSSKALSSIL